jgi:hypothetical protein
LAREGDLIDPAAIAQVINSRDELAAEILAHIEEMFASVATGRASRRTIERVSTLLSALGEAGIAKLLGMEGLERANVMVSGDRQAAADGRRGTAARRRPGERRFRFWSHAAPAAEVRGGGARSRQRKGQRPPVASGDPPHVGRVDA